MAPKKNHKHRYVVDFGPFKQCAKCGVLHYRTSKSENGKIKSIRVYSYGQGWFEGSPYCFRKTGV